MAHIKCKFISLGTVTREPIPARSDWNDVPHGIRAHVICLEDHPVLGSPSRSKTRTEVTVTSRVMMIDFERRMLRTESGNTYHWE